MRQAGLRPTAPRASGPPHGDLEAAVESHCEAPQAASWKTSQARPRARTKPGPPPNAPEGSGETRRRPAAPRNATRRTRSALNALAATWGGRHWATEAVRVPESPVRRRTGRSGNEVWEESEGGLVPSPGTWPATQDPGNERRGPPAGIPSHLLHLAHGGWTSELLDFEKPPRNARSPKFGDGRAKNT